MNITVSKDVLTKALARAQGIVKHSTTNPTLSCVLLRARGDKLTVCATDTMVTLVAEYPASVFQEDEVAVDGRLLYQIVRAAPGPDLDLEVKGKTRLRVTSGTSASHLNLFPVDDYPPLTKLEAASQSLTLTGAALARLITGTGYAVGDNESRYGLNGAHMESVPGPDGVALLRMVATDGSRMSWAQVPFEGTVGLDRRSLLAPKGLTEVLKLIETSNQPWTVSFAPRMTAFEAPGVRLLSRNVEGEFPDYKQVLPAGYHRECKVERGPFIEAAKRIGLFATDRNHSVGFYFEESRLVLVAENRDSGDGREEVAAELSGDPLTTGFNLSYVLEALSVTRGKSITFRMNGQLDPTNLHVEGEDDVFTIVMPMRLD